MKTIAMCALLAALAFGLLPGNRDEAAAPDEGLVLLVETQQDAQAPQKASSARQNQSEKAAVQTAPDAQTVRLLDGGAVAELSMEDYLTGVLLSEMPADFETEARKAQAVAEGRLPVGSFCSRSMKMRTFARRLPAVRHGQAGSSCGRNMEIPLKQFGARRTRRSGRQQGRF